MTNPGPFSDLGKAAKEALFKEKLLRDFNTKDQVNFANTSSTGVKFSGKVTREDASKYSGQIEIKFPKEKEWGTEGGVTFDTKGKTKVSVAQSDRVAPGLKLSAAVEYVHSDAPKRDLHLHGEYKREHLTTSTKAIVPVSKSGPAFAEATVESNVVLGLEDKGVAVGVEAKYHAGSNKLKSLFVQTQYQRGNFTILGYSNDIRVPDKGNATHSCGVMYHLKLDKAVLKAAEVAAEVEYDVLSQADNVTVSLGFGWNPADNVRIQAKADSRGAATVIGTHTLNANTKIRGGVELSYDNLSLKKNFLELSFFD